MDADFINNFDFDMKLLMSGTQESSTSTFPLHLHPNLDTTLNCPIRIPFSRDQVQVSVTPAAFVDFVSTSNNPPHWTSHRLCRCGDEVSIWMEIFPKMLLLSTEFLAVASTRDRESWGIGLNMILGQKLNF